MGGSARLPVCFGRFGKRHRAPSSPECGLDFEAMKATKQLLLEFSAILKPQT